MRLPTTRACVLALALLLATACDSGSSGDGGSPGAATPSATGAVPKAIVSLSPTATEMLFAIGAGDQVVAVDDFSTFPPEAPTTDLSALEPNVEAVASYEPDLVVISNDPADVVKSLDRLGIPVLLQLAAATLDDTYSQITELGTATGHVGEANALVASMRSEIDAIVSSAPEFMTSPTYYHELDDLYFTVTSETFIGHVYGLLGLRNIADEAKGAGSGYPQLSAEYIVDADPDIIFLADTKCCNQSAETIGRRPGWDQISAVMNGAVVELDDDIASRWGPRVVDFLRTVAASLMDLES